MLQGKSYHPLLPLPRLMHNRTLRRDHTPTDLL